MATKDHAMAFDKCVMVASDETNIVVDVFTTKCTPLSGQLARLPASDLRRCASALGIRGPDLTNAELARAVAAAIVVARDK